MEQSILQKKLAEKYCLQCGALGRWKITRTAGPVRYLQCTACGIGGDRCLVIVTAAEVQAALKAALATLVAGGAGPRAGA